MHLLVYSHTTSPRLEYTCAFVFEQMMGVNFAITTDIVSFHDFTGAKINYSEADLADCFKIGPMGLLLETGIRQHNTACYTLDKYKIFFRQEGTVLGFDVLSAIFYLLSRYEEYLPHEKDAYGRFAHHQSLAFQEGFLHLPIVNSWINHLAEFIQQQYPACPIQLPGFTNIPSFDIDMAWSYLHKGWLRNAAGFFRSPTINRLLVLCRLAKDPFDVFDWLFRLHTDYDVQPLYFFLLAEKPGVYDKNISPANEEMKALIRELGKNYRIGIHPSWQSGDAEPLLKNEKERLEAILGKRVVISRQHYLRFSLPGAYEKLLDQNITDDYSMGYGSINGFRASVAATFYWYNLRKEVATCLKIHPFCFMDANSYYEQQLSAEAAGDELNNYLHACKKVNGQLITIWHNSLVSDHPRLLKWKGLYKRFITTIH